MTQVPQKAGLPKLEGDTRPPTKLEILWRRFTLKFKPWIVR
jgi:hypothetical protein